MRDFKITQIPEGGKDGELWEVHADGRRICFFFARTMLADESRWSYEGCSQFLADRRPELESMFDAGEFPGEPLLVNPSKPLVELSPWPK